MHTRATWTRGSAGLLLLVIALGPLGPGLAAAADKPLKKVTFLTNYVFHGRHSPYFVGLEKGLYQKWQAADPGVYFSLLLEGKVDLLTASIEHR